MFEKHRRRTKPPAARRDPAIAGLYLGVCALGDDLQTASGEVLDTTCQNYYGHLNGAIEAVLDANQGLVEKVQPFKAELLIHMPDLLVLSNEGMMLWVEGFLLVRH